MQDLNVRIALVALTCVVAGMLSACSSGPGDGPSRAGGDGEPDALLVEPEAVPTRVRASLEYEVQDAGREVLRATARGELERHERDVDGEPGLEIRWRLIDGAEFGDWESNMSSRYTATGTLHWNGSRDAEVADLQLHGTQHADSEEVARMDDDSAFWEPHRAGIARLMEERWASQPVMAPLPVGEWTLNEWRTVDDATAAAFLDGWDSHIRGGFGQEDRQVRPLDRWTVRTARARYTGRERLEEAGPVLAFDYEVTGVRVDEWPEQEHDPQRSVVDLTGRVLVDEDTHAVVSLTAVVTIAVNQVPNDWWLGDGTFASGTYTVSGDMKLEAEYED